MKYRSEYRYFNRFGTPTHIWQVIGAKGAIHLHITESGIEEMEYYGGLEMHWRSPPNYMKNNAPSQDECSILKCPCWHDGSSLAATETWIPRWLLDKHNHEHMFRLLEKELESLLGDTDES